MNVKDSLAKNILLGLGVIGVVSLVMVAPGLAKALPLLSKIDLRKINQEVKRLRKRGMIEMIKNKHGIEEIKLTKLGRAKIKEYKISDIKIDKTKNWDKKWRIVIFDIPIQKNKSRNLLRRKMRELGFYKLQDSVFVHAYPCFEIVEFIRVFFGVKAEVEYIEAEKLESQNKLLAHFFT